MNNIAPMYIMLANKIYLNVFLSSLAIGMLLVYLMGEDKKVVYVYPNSASYQDIMFQDTSRQCYQYKPVESSCPSDESRIKKIPIQ
jgi:hypothetical protein